MTHAERAAPFVAAAIILAVSGCFGSGDLIVGIWNETESEVQATIHILYVTEHGIELNESFEAHLSPHDSQDVFERERLSGTGELRLIVHFSNGTTESFTLPEWRPGHHSNYFAVWIFDDRVEFTELMAD